jgi:hypothetical protein
MDVKSSMGWGSEQTSELRVTLVQDIADGDVPAPPPMGTPVYFQLGNFKFAGLLQRWTKRRSTSGNPIWEAVCNDPREILRSAQLIIGDYNGSNYGMRNLINVFGWWENNFGFGSSLANDSGMPWNLIKVALTSICNQPLQTIYGGPLNSRGFSYALDLTELPVPDIHYRMGRGFIGLMDAITQLCDDGGVDFFVELVGFTIKVRTVSRLNQPPLGTIAAITETNTGNVLRTEDGFEARNEVTSAFLTGGAVCQIHQTDSTNMASFWGYDILGRPIIGIPGTAKFFGPIPAGGGAAPLLAEVSTEYMDLNATGVEDIVGSVYYPCSTVEMRLAMVNYESWSSFMWNYKPQFRNVIYSPFKNPIVDGALAPAGKKIVRPDMINDAKAIADMVANVNSDVHVKAQRLYEYVRGYATEFYGKQFLVGLPFILSRRDPETLQITHTQEPTDGGYLPEDSPPLGLSPLNQDVFKTGDGRFRAFVGFAGLAGLDLSRVNPGDSIVENNTLYLRANVNPSIVFLPGNKPAALINLGSAVYHEAIDSVGDSKIVAAVLQMPPAQAQPWLERNFGPIGLRIHPIARYPSATAIPLKNNVLTYGPWYVIGAPGKVRYENDPSMTPWNFGGWSNMNLAGAARVLNAVTNMQVSESGSIDLVGAPSASLGDVLEAGGPNITNIDISYGRDGITTSYRFQTYTPRFGVFSKPLADRIKQIGLTAQQLRKNVRANINQGLAAAETSKMAFQGFLANAPKAVNPKTPHEVVVAHCLTEQDQSGKTQIRVAPMTMTYEEAVALAKSNGAYAQTAVCSLDGILRPFTTKVGAGEAALMPAFVTPSATQGLHVGNLNPFVTGNDITYLANKQTYDRLHTFESGNDVADTRGVALRGPVMVAGWGFDMDGKPVPGNGSGSWLDNVLRRSDKWKVGPVDMLWDERRGVWTSHDLLAGTIGNISAGGSGLMTVTGYTGWNLMVYNLFSSTAPSGKVIAGYIAPLHRWYVIAADCTT